MENQFFSLSCLLHGHVTATPDYSGGKAWDRGWPQHLYLSPTSSLLPKIKLPENFDVLTTPLVTFRRIDILFSKEELVDIHREIQPPGTKLEDDSLFGESAVWTVPPAEYLAEFLAPLPKGNYNTMVVNTAGHWTIETFAKTAPPGIDGVLNLFKHAVKRWADKVEEHIRASDHGPARLTWRLGPFAKKVRRKRVVVRAYLPGHEDCHSFRKPWKTVEPFKWNWWNWGEIWKFNEIFEVLIFGFLSLWSQSTDGVCRNFYLTERSIRISTTLALTDLLGCALMRYVCQIFHRRQCYSCLCTACYGRLPPHHDWCRSVGGLDALRVAVYYKGNIMF